MSVTEPPLRIRLADHGWARARGLIAYPRLRLGEGLWLRPCRAVHAWGMSYPLDVVFLDADQRIVKIGVLRPGGCLGCWAARSVVELAPGSVRHYRWQRGEVFPIP